MSDKEKSEQKSGTLVDKIENQLQEILTKRKEEIERSLEDRIRQERDDAQRKLEEIEEDYESEKESLLNYRAKFSEIETRRDEIKNRIKIHLEQAVIYQNEISGLTGNTLEELKKVGDLNQQLDDYQKQAESELADMKKDLESKYGIVAAFPESNGHEDVDFNLEQELSKLKKIKELLGSRDIETNTVETSQFLEEEELEKVVDVDPAVLDSEPEEAHPEVDIEPESTVPEADPQADPEGLAPDPFGEEYEEQVESQEEAADLPEEPAEADPIEVVEEPELPETMDPVLDTEEITETGEPQIEFQIPFISQPEEEPGSDEEGQDVEVTHPAFDDSPADISQEGEEISYVAEELNDSKIDPDVPSQPEASVPEENLSPPEEKEETHRIEANFQDVFEKLEQYRKGSCTEDNGDVSYFQDEEKIILDGECLVSSLTNSLDGAKNLYKKLNETESPKEQFFIKQDIIRYQEILRKLMLSSIKMCEKESCTLPLYTREILNVEVLKTILEKVSMENWSDEQDFLEFDKYAKSLKDDYYARITPPARYIQSILEELEK